MKKFDHELIMCIVNEGFSDAVMDAAREVGARGGTVIDAHGTANREAEKLFRIVVQPQKEIVMIVVPTELRDTVLHALYKEVGLNTPGQGIAFAMPVDNVVGIGKTAIVAPEADGEAEDAQDEESCESVEENDDNADNGEDADDSEGEDSTDGEDK